VGDDGSEFYAEREKSRQGIYPPPDGGPNRGLIFILLVGAWLTLFLGWHQAMLWAGKAKGGGDGDGAG